MKKPPADASATTRLPRATPHQAAARAGVPATSEPVRAQAGPTRPSARAPQAIAATPDGSTTSSITR